MDLEEMKTWLEGLTRLFRRRYPAALLAAALAVSCRNVPSVDEEDALRAPTYDMVGFECGGEMRESVEAWSSGGQAMGCVQEDERHGRWLFWEEGYVNLEGFYSRGRKHGTWTVFNRDGSAFVRILFENGKKTKKEYFPQAP